MIIREQISNSQAGFTTLSQEAVTRIAVDQIISEVQVRDAWITILEELVQNQQISIDRIDTKLTDGLDSLKAQLLGGAWYSTPSTQVYATLTPASLHDIETRIKAEVSIGSHRNPQDSVLRDMIRDVPTSKEIETLVDDINKEFKDLNVMIKQFNVHLTAAEQNFDNRREELYRVWYYIADCMKDVMQYGQDMRSILDDTADQVKRQADYAYASFEQHRNLLLKSAPQAYLAFQDQVRRITQQGKDQLVADVQLYLEDPRSQMAQLRPMVSTRGPTTSVETQTTPQPQEPPITPTQERPMEGITTSPNTKESLSFDPKPKETRTPSFIDDLTPQELELNYQGIKIGPSDQKPSPVSNPSLANPFQTPERKDIFTSQTLFNQPPSVNQRTTNEILNLTRQLDDNQAQLIAQNTTHYQNIEQQIKELNEKMALLQFATDYQEPQTPVKRRYTGPHAHTRAKETERKRKDLTPPPSPKQ